MKTLLLIIGLSISGLYIQAQTKGMNTIGLGFNSQKTEQNTYNQGTVFTMKYTSSIINLGYGHFIKENNRIGVDLLYGKDNTSGTASNEFNSNVYGGNLNYQQYFPLIKKFYAFGGLRAGYSFTKGTLRYPGVFDEQVSRSNSYLIGGAGGVTWFLFKRIAFEAQLLSADLVYTKTRILAESSQSEDAAETTSTNLNLSTSGTINGLGFKIYFLF